MTNVYKKWAISFALTLLMFVPANADQQEISKLADADLSGFAEQYMRALLARDTEYVSENSVSDPDIDYSLLTTVSDHVYDLPELIQHLEELPPVSFGNTQLKEFVADDVAWIVGIGYATLPAGDELPIRMTMIARYTNSKWGISHVHVSESFIRTLEADQ